ncbi:MAG TPA: DMT family transporter [Vicinamibacterales bacterium]|nr:DMT family transporter [Vicinamibacterales bacterium]
MTLGTARWRDRQRNRVVTARTVGRSRAAAFWCYLNALRSGPATTAGIFPNLTPVFGVASAYIFLGERLTQTQWIGGATILLSVLALLTWAAAPKARASAE